MKTTRICRDFNTPNDQFICTTRDGLEPTPSFPLYSQGLHAPMPIYNDTRWQLIEYALAKIVNLGPDLTFVDFTFFYNSYKNFPDEEQDFTVLEALIDSGWRGGTVLNTLLPHIAHLALQLPKEIKQPIKLLLANENGSLTLSQRQAAIILANAFYSTFPPSRNRKRFCRINFNSLFERTTPRALEKLKCILHYFAEFMERSPSGCISIIRQKIAEPEKLEWSAMEMPLVALTVMPTGKIEDEGEQMTQLDFANQYIGGGVLGHGCVQEEIRFLICPEMIISCLICEKMQPDEAILIVGAERYSNYDGYDRTFRWLHRPRFMAQDLPRDNQGRLKSQLLAVDALCYARFPMQFREPFIHRELVKAYAGFSLQTETSPEEIATGNWGCGAFGGDLHLKSMIQLIATSAVNRPLYYFTFGGEIFADKLNKIVEMMKANGITTGQLYQLIIAYGKSDCVRRNGLFRWIKERINNNENENRSQCI